MRFATKLIMMNETIRIKIAITILIPVLSAHSVMLVKTVFQSLGNLLVVINI